jgi:trimeric autotransporter adhesin
MKNLLILSSILVASACSAPMGRDPLPALDVLQVVPGTARVTAGDTLQLGALRLKDSTTTNVSDRATWTSSDPLTVAVDANGKAKTKKAGTATVTATFEGKTGTSEIIVLGQVISAEVGAGDVIIPVGITRAIGATLITDDNRKRALEGTEVFGTSNAAVASVSATGAVTGESAGSAVITLTRDGVTYSSRPVTVVATELMSVVARASPNATVPSRGSTSLSVVGTFANGQQEDVTGFFNVSGPDAGPDAGVGINLAGTTVTGDSLDGGSRMVTLSFVGRDGGLAAGKSASLVVTVTSDPLSSITVNAPMTASTQGEAGRLSAIGLYGTLNFPISGAQYTTTPADVASVARSGAVAWVKPGTVTFKSTVGTVSGEATTMVTDANLTGVTIGGAGPVSVGGKLALTATAAFGATNNTVTSIVLWKSSAPNIAEVSNVASGSLTGRSLGTATIEAFYRGVRAASVMVTVSAPDAGMMATDAGTDAGMMMMMDAGMTDAGMTDAGTADSGM